VIRGALLMAAGVALAIYTVATSPGCYDPNKPPPCDPSTIDWPRCIDPTQPMAVRDGGSER